MTRLLCWQPISANTAITRGDGRERDGVRKPVVKLLVAVHNEGHEMEDIPLLDYDHHISLPVAVAEALGLT